MDDGLKIVLSPVQLAAALSDNSVNESETMSNRLMGGLGLIMGNAGAGRGNCALYGTRAYRLNKGGLHRCWRAQHGQY